MKFKLKRLLHPLTALILCLALLCPLPVSAADLYFTSINDSLAKLTTDTMPLWSGGTLYVPYTVFDANTNSTGISLGMNSGYSRNSNTVTLYNLRQMLVFDLNTGTCRDDATGETYSGHAIVRNGKPYLPLDTVCKYFGLTRSYTPISQGYLVRIKNDAVVLSDAKFIDAAGELINRRVREYNQSLNPTPTPDPVKPTTPTTPTPTPPVEEHQTDVRTYLAFRCEDTASVPALLDILAQQHTYALFLFTPKALEEDNSLILRVLGSGHSIGLLAEGGTLDETRALLEQGSQSLAQTARLRTTVAAVPKEQRAALSQEGWICWRETLDLAPPTQTSASTFAARTLRRLNGRTLPTYLTMEGNDNARRVLPTLLRQLESKHFQVSIPMETKL